MKLCALSSTSGDRNPRALGVERALAKLVHWLSRLRCRSKLRRRRQPGLGLLPGSRTYHTTHAMGFSLSRSRRAFAIFLRRASMEASEPMKTAQNSSMQML
ncbi:unnamed protein product, partial [Musa banksii]